MTRTNSRIDGFSVYDGLLVIRTIPGLPDATTITKAWLMVKRRKSDADVDAVISKEITSVLSASIGQITDTGADGTGQLEFRINHTDSDNLTAGQAYYYAIKILLSTGRPETIETGTMVADPAYITATS